MNTILKGIPAKLSLAIAATLIAGAALAAPATATSGVNVRTGPGGGYAKVDTLHAGEAVDVKQCQGSWCYVEHNGPDGWVSKNYLAYGGGGNQANPLQDCGIAIGPNGVQVGCGAGAPGNNPPPPPVYSKVCFYNGANFQGARFCVKPGHGNMHLSGYWNDRISSVKVYGNAKAKICGHANMNGFCSMVTSSRAHLPALNNKISSYWVQ